MSVKKTALVHEGNMSEKKTALGHVLFVVGILLAVSGIFGVSLAYSAMQGSLAIESDTLDTAALVQTSLAQTRVTLTAIGGTLTVLGGLLWLFQYIKYKTFPSIDFPRLKDRIRRYWGFYILFLPVAVFVIIFHYLPMFGIYFAFTKYNIISAPKFVGLDQFKRLFGMPGFWTAFKNTLELSIIKLIMTTFLSVLISLLLNEMISIKGKKLAQTIIYLPHFMSWVVTASVFQLILSPTTTGLVNQFLLSTGLIKEGIYFLGDNKWWRFSYYLINVWHDTGWGTIIFMATLTGIDPGVYEAGSIDGAGRFQKMWYITMPALADTIVTVLILNLAKIMNLFESVFVLQNDATMNTSQVLQTYVYYQTFNSGGIPDYGYTTAIGLFRSLVGMALMLACNGVSHKLRGRGIM